MQEKELESQGQHVLLSSSAYWPRLDWGACVCAFSNLHGGAGGRGLSPSEEFKPAARVAIPEEKGVGVTEGPRLLMVDQGPQGVAQEGREGPWAPVITFQRLHDLEFLGQVGAAAEGHAREAGELGEARVRAQRHDALGGRQGAAEQLALRRQLPELPLLLLLEEPPLREVILPAEGQPPQRSLQVLGARGARGPRLLARLLVSGRKRGRVSVEHPAGGAVQRTLRPYCKSARKFGQKWGSRACPAELILSVGSFGGDGRRAARKSTQAE